MQSSIVSFLLLTPFNPAVFESCLSQFYYGTHGRQAIFITDDTCLGAASDLLTVGSIVPLQRSAKRLIWFEREAVEESLLLSANNKELDEFLSSLTASPRTFEWSGGEQEHMQASNPPISLISGEEYAIVSLPDEVSIQDISNRLPRFWKYTPLPAVPVPFLPVPPSAISRVVELLAAVKFSPDVAELVANLSVPQIRNDIRYLTGEDAKSPILSRHSFSDGANIAADWLKARMEETGATCELQPFLSGFAPNVICAYPSSEETTETVLLSAHYDSRGSFGSTRAPGGDDDGSGTVALLSIARTIARRNVQFRKNVQICFFAGEEQGLLGSKAYAREMRALNANLTLMVQADMLAYHRAGEPPQLGLPDLIGTSEVTQLVANLSAIYSPELTVGYTPACCSDHQSYHEQGFPSTQVFERAGPIADPMYHNSGDLSDRQGYDFEQLRSIAKVQFATILHAAGYDIADVE